jgi:hypothetical protein
MTSVLRSYGSLALATGLLAACGPHKRPPAGDDAELSAPAKSDSFSQLSVEGMLSYGGAATVRYANPPKYRAFSFYGSAGDNVQIWVRSGDGDAMAWLLDSHLKVLKSNDDASPSTTDSHIGHTLKKSEVYYIVLREYSLSDANFTVTLAGDGSPIDLNSCTQDSDCVRVISGCCAFGDNWTAVTRGLEGAYRDSLGCAAHPVCPAIAFSDDHSMPECVSGQCQAVRPQSISCGGGADAHACPAGWDCEASDGGPGACMQLCGGIASLGCPSGQSCVDRPMSGCRVAQGDENCFGWCE